MREIFSAYKSYFYVLLVLLVIAVVFISITISLLFPPKTQETVSVKTNDQQPASLYTKTFINTSPKNLEEDPTFIKKSSLRNGNILYEFSSPDNLVHDEVITKHGTVIYEKVITVDSYAKHPTISSYKKTYGDPQAIKRGSKTLGSFMTFFIYASKGITLLGNPFTDEVYQIQTYAPMTVNEYIQLWGDDIDKTPKNKEAITN